MNFNLKRNTLLAVAGAVFVLPFVAAHSASAQQTTFATFTQANTSSTPFTFTNSGSGSTMTASTQVDWNWLVDSGVTTTGTPINATMTFTAVVTGTATSSANMPLIRQGLNITDLVFTDNANGKVLLNVVTPEAATLIGQKGSSTGSINGINAAYSSQFLTFGAPDTGKLTLTLASINPTLAKASNNYLRGFSSTGTGSFSNGTRPVPEFGTIMSLGMMATGGGVFSVRRRRRTTDAKGKGLTAA